MRSKEWNIQYEIATFWKNIELSTLNKISVPTESIANKIFNVLREQINFDIEDNIMKNEKH